MPIKTIIVRIKSKADMPDVAGCCPTITKRLEDYYGKEYEVIPIPVKGCDVCVFCGKEITFMGFQHINEPHILGFDYMDIDEGVLHEHTQQNSRNET